MHICLCIYQSTSTFLSLHHNKQAVITNKAELIFTVHCAFEEFPEVLPAIWPLELALAVDLTVPETSSVLENACRTPVLLDAFSPAYVIIPVKPPFKNIIWASLSTGASRFPITKVAFKGNSISKGYFHMPVWYFTRK